MSEKNFYRTYTLKAGKMKGQGFEIGTINSPTQECLHISFSVEKSNSESANTSKIQIWNLSKSSLAILDQKDAIVELKAGYDNNNALALVGNITSVITTSDNADRMTEIEVVDGRVALRDGTATISINGSVNCKDVYKRLADAMGASIVFAKDLSFVTLPNGFSFVGQARTGLQKLAACCKHSWSIQNGVIQVTWPGRAISTKGYLLNSESGLIGTPKKITISESSKDKKSRTGWEVTYLMNCAIGVNNIVRIESDTANGYYLVHKVTIDGDNMEGDWQCTAQVLVIKEEPKKDKAAASSSSGKKGSSSKSSGGNIKKGDKVKVTRTVKQGSKTKGYQYSGGMFTCYHSVYDVIQVKGDRVLIGIGSTVTAAVKAADLAKA